MQTDCEIVSPIILDITSGGIAACKRKSHHLALVYQVLWNFFLKLSLYHLRRYHPGFSRQSLHVFALGLDGHSSYECFFFSVNHKKTGFVSLFRPFFLCFFFRTIHADISDNSL